MAVCTPAAAALALSGSLVAAWDPRLDRCVTTAAAAAAAAAAQSVTARSLCPVSRDGRHGPPQTLGNRRAPSSRPRISATARVPADGFPATEQIPAIVGHPAPTQVAMMNSGTGLGWDWDWDWD